MSVTIFAIQKNMQSKPALHYTAEQSEVKRGYL